MAMQSRFLWPATAKRALATSRLEQPAGSITAFVRRLWLTWSNRRAARQLLYLDDRMLADIGLTRDDVRRASALSFGADVTRQLQRVADDNRACDRRRMRSRAHAAAVRRPK